MEGTSSNLLMRVFAGWNLGRFAVNEAEKFTLQASGDEVLPSNL